MGEPRGSGGAIVRQMQRAGSEARKKFARTPQLYLKDALAGVLSDDDIERLFIETEQYSARVRLLKITI